MIPPIAKVGSVVISAAWRTSSRPASLVKLFVVEGNTFQTGRTGVYLRRVAAPSVVRNRVRVPNGNGISLADLDATYGTALVANNAVVTEGTGTAYALQLVRANDVRVWHNSVASRAAGTSAALHVFGGGDALDVRNNAFANLNTAGGYVYYFESALPTASTWKTGPSR